MSDANRVQVSFAEETTFGTAPTGNYQILRLLSEDFRQEQETVNSDELRSDRRIADVKRVGLRGVGGFQGELSYGAYDALLEAVLFSSDWSTEVSITETTISVATSDNSINDSAGDFTADGFLANQWIKVSGFATADNNGYYKIVSVASTKMVLSHKTVDSDEAAGPSVTVRQGARIVDGTEKRSFTFEKDFQDLTNEFETARGMTPDGLTLSVEPGSIMQIGMTFLGKDCPSAVAAPGSGYTAATTDVTMSSVDHVDALIEGGTAFSSTSFSMQLANNLRERLEIATLGASSIGAGSINISGTLQAFFTSQPILNKFLNDTESSIALTLTDPNGKGYVIDIPRVKYSSGQRLAGGINTDVIADLAFSAYVHSSESFSLGIQRFP